MLRRTRPMSHWSHRGKFALPALLMLGLAFGLLATPLHASQQDGTLHTQNVLFSVQAAPPAQESCDNPANPIVAENCKPGATDWMIENNLGDIEGFAYPDSVNIGETINFYVNTSAPQFNAEIFRSGYYGGAGARLVTTLEGVAGQAQPDCHSEFSTGLVSCSNWSVSYPLTIPDDWVSGTYLVRLTNTSTGGTGYMIFVVRDDERPAQILYQQSTSTFQAYNNYRGPSVYDNSDSSGAVDCVRESGTDRAVKVSLMRPYSQSFFTFDNLYVHTEYPMVRWLESQGYDVTYATNYDVHRWGIPGQTNELLDHPIYLSVGHDEYWSSEMRDAVTQARDAGVNLGFLSANTAYWRIRMEDDPYTGEPNSVMVTYKTTQGGGRPDPSGIPTGTWRDPAGANDPENELIGNLYIGDNDEFYFPLQISADYSQDTLYRHTDLQQMPPNTYTVIDEDVYGWEWNAALDNGVSPEGLEIVAASPVYGFLLHDAGDFYAGSSGQGAAHITRYRASSGALVYSVGTILWAWGLGAHGVEEAPVNPYIQQMTVNLLADLGAQPATPTDDVILDDDADSSRLITGAEFLTEDSYTPPTISNVQITFQDNRINVTWETDVPTRGQIWYGDDTEHLINFWNSDSEGFSRQHSINRIVPYNATMAYQVVALSERDALGTTTPSTFTTDRGSTLTQIRNALALGNIPIQIRCSYLAQPALTIGVGIAIGLAVLLVVALVLRFIVRRLRPRRATSTA